MAATTKMKWLDYAIFGSSVFLVFCLIFNSFIVLPRFVTWLGHWHPLILHFPIVLLLLSIFLGLTAKQIPKPLMATATFTALITAISGFFLGVEAGAKGDLLFWHQWLGGGTALLAALWYWLDGQQLQHKMYTKVLQVVLLIVIGLTGHYGGMVTHGEDFLAFPSDGIENDIPDNPLIYKDVVAKIIDQRCIKCHNSNKKKGELLMTSVTDLLKGGESGAVIIPGNAEESELIARLHLPDADEKHMPPEGEKNLTASEIQILERWIALGASDTLQLSHLDNSEPLVALIDALKQPKKAQKWKDLPPITDEQIAQLSSDYVTIKRIANAINALSVNMYMPPEYTPEMVQGLQPLAENIVTLDVSGLPLGSLEMNTIASFKNLEWLEVDRTPITDKETDTLKALSKLSTLKIYDTNIGDKSLLTFKQAKNLKQIYLWKTAVSPAALEKFKLEKPSVLVHKGIEPEIQALFAKKDSISKN